MIFESNLLLVAHDNFTMQHSKLVDALSYIPQSNTAMYNHSIRVKHMQVCKTYFIKYHLLCLRKINYNNKSSILSVTRKK